MTDHLFDTFVRDKLADHASPVPGGLWDKIEAATAEKERKKGFAIIPPVYYRVAVLLIVCAAAGALFLWLKPTNNPKEITQQKPSQIAPSHNTGGEGRKETTATLPEATTNTGNVVFPRETGTNGSETTGTTVTGPAAASGTNHASSTTAISPLQETITRKRHPVNAVASTTPLLIAGSTILPATNNSTPLADAPTDASPFSFLNAEMISLKTLSNYSSTGLHQLLNTQSNKLLPIIRCPVVRNTVPKDLYVEVYASPDMVMKNTSANYGGADYLARKDSSQRLQTSFTAGIRVSKALTENLLIKTGVQYSQVNEHFNYRVENEKKLVTVITIHKIPVSPGDTLFVRDTSSYEQIGYLQKKTYNKYKSIDIPVLFSYEWGNDNWRLAANLGAIVNIHSWYNGEMLDTSYQPVSLKTATREVYKSNIGLGLYAGFSIIKPVSENMDLFAEPYFRYNLGDMTNKGQPFNQRLHTAGLSFGIRYRLNGGQHF